ncbi:MAG: hypothetical protein LRZ90_06465 [Thermodesulfovibrionales bacterium]|nr:hypothetical protein [Thermodesulfovibrionales bacterium]
MEVVWTEYMKYRAKLRSFDLDKIKHIMRYSTERYYDIATQRLIVVGRHNEMLVLVPYEREGNKITPITVHATTRQQINFRLKMGRFRNE